MNAQITTREELDALPEDSVIASIPGDEKARLDAGVAVWCKFNERWFGSDCTSADEVDYIIGEGSLFILYRPDEPQRVQPSRKDIERTIGLHRVSDPSGGCWTEAWCDCTCGQRIAVPGGTRDEAARRGGQHLAEAVLSLFASQHTVAEVRVETLREAAAVARLDRAGGLSWIARAVEAWLNARADRIAAAGRESEGGAR